MVMGDNNRRSSVYQGVSKHLARVNGCSIDQADRDNTNIQDFIDAVNTSAQKMLLFTISIMSDMGK